MHCHIYIYIIYMHAYHTPSVRACWLWHLCLTNILGAQEANSSSNSSSACPVLRFPWQTSFLCLAKQLFKQLLASKNTTRKPRWRHASLRGLRSLRSLQNWAFYICWRLRQTFIESWRASELPPNAAFPKTGSCRPKSGGNQALLSISAISSSSK